MIVIARDRQRGKTEALIEWAKKPSKKPRYIVVPTRNRQDQFTGLGVQTITVGDLIRDAYGPSPKELAFDDLELSIEAMFPRDTVAAISVTPYEPVKPERYIVKREGVWAIQNTGTLPVQNLVKGWLEDTGDFHEIWFEGNFIWYREKEYDESLSDAGSMNWNKGDWMTRDRSGFIQHYSNAEFHAKFEVDYGSDESHCESNE